MMRPLSRTFWKLSGILLLLACPALATPGIDPAVERALLAGRWEDVVRGLQANEAKADDPVARLLMAHATLATNQNNASLMLFLATQATDDRAAWAAWTTSLLARTPDHPVALYLAADAAARQGRFAEAKATLTRALDRQPAFGLAYNARGVLHLVTNAWDHALVDLTMATRHAPNLADANANLASYYILTETAQGALQAFTKALQISPTFALAYNGRGCAYFGIGQFEAAVNDFVKAAELVPSLAIAPVNQGFATAYAARFLTLVMASTRPGMTLESIHREEPVLLQDQQQELRRLVPSQEDRELWQQIRSLPLLSPEQRAVLVQNHGLMKVQMAASLELQGLLGESSQLLKETRQLETRVGRYNAKILGLAVGETLLSLGMAARGTALDVQKGSEVAGLSADRRITKAFGSSLPHRGWSLFFSAIPLSKDPVTLAATAVGVGSKIGRYHLEDRRTATLEQMTNRVQQAVLVGAKVRAYAEALRTLPSGSAPDSTRRSTSSIPAYYTSTDRPLAELGAMAGMVDKGIPTTQGQPRTALIVGDDPLRTVLLQRELSNRGFQTRVVPPGTNPVPLARQLGTDVILGIRQGEVATLGAMSRLDPTQQDADRWKVPLPPGPPDKFGGAGVPGVAPSARPVPPPAWDWGKPFSPVQPQIRPGGVTMEEFARSFVDKGNWPVLTAFSLVYTPGPPPEGAQK